MRNRTNLFLWLSFFLFSSLFFVQTTLTVGVGFVPATRLWFSDISFPPRESTWMYTVIINNSYYKLDAKIGFYINGQLVDTAEIHQLPNLEAVQVRGLWHPAVGNFKVGVQFISATGIDETGKRTVVDVRDINTVDNTSISIGPPPIQTPEKPVSSTQVATNLIPSDGNNSKTPPVESSSTILSPGLLVSVTKDKDQLVIAPIPNSANLALSPMDEFKKKFEKNAAEAEQKITGVTNAVTSTLKNVSSFINAGKEVVEKGKMIVDKGVGLWPKASNLFSVTLLWWDRLSHHNNPLQIGKIILLFLVFRWLFKFLMRRRDRDS